MVTEMKILIINQFFYPDIAATAQLMTDLTEDLAAKNADITVLTSNSNYLGGKIDLSKNGHFLAAKIIRVNCLSFGRKHVVGRVLDYLSFLVMILGRALFLPRYDIVLALTTPPLVAGVGLVLKIVKKSKFVCLVEDLYPDTAIALGVLGEKSIIVTATEKISRFIYRCADCVVAISGNMKRKLIDKGIDENKITVIDNWADRRLIYPISKKKNWFIEMHRMNDKFVVQYSGNMGLGHDFDTFLNGLARLQAFDDIRFLFVGDGPRKEDIMTFKKSHSLNNLTCIPYQDRKDLAFSIGAGDVSLISLRKSLDGCIVPSKLYGIMAAARPIIFVGSSESDIARIILRARCGFQVEEGDVDAFVKKVLDLYHNPELAIDLGKKGHAYFLEHFERKRSTDMYQHLFENVMSVRP